MISPDYFKLSPSLMVHIVTSTQFVLKIINIQYFIFTAIMPFHTRTLPLYSMR